MKAYRIMTEDTNRARLTALVSERFDCFSVYNGTGYWKGNAEQSLTIEIIDVDGSIPSGAIDSLALAIKELNKQEAVLITVSDIEGKLI